jgi:hypothetical protein
MLLSQVRTSELNSHSLPPTAYPPQPSPHNLPPKAYFHSWLTPHITLPTACLAYLLKRIPHIPP